MPPAGETDSMAQPRYAKPARKSDRIVLCGPNPPFRDRVLEAAACEMPGNSLMKAWMLGSSRRLCANAMTRTRPAAAIGIAHRMLTQYLPIRIFGTMPSRGGSQCARTMRSSAELSVEASEARGGDLISTESAISRTFSASLKAQSSAASVNGTDPGSRREKSQRSKRMVSSRDESSMPFTECCTQPSR